MLISKEWLSEYVTVEQSVEALAEKITRTGIEVDDIVDLTEGLKTLSWVMLKISNLIQMPIN